MHNLLLAVSLIAVGWCAASAVVAWGYSRHYRRQRTLVCEPGYRSDRLELIERRAA